MLNRIHTTVCASLVLVVLASANPAAADTNPGAFSLLKAAPADAFITVVGKGNPEQAFLDAYWAEVLTAFHESGILEDVWDMITDAVPDEHLEEIEELQERCSSLCKEVDWGGLVEREMIYIGRFNIAHGFSDGMPYEGIWLFRMENKKQAASNYRHLKAILEEIVKLIETKVKEDAAVRISEKEIGGATVTMIGPAVIPYALSIGYSDDVLVMSLFNRSIIQECLGLLNGSSKAKRLIATDRFKQAVSQLPEAEDTLVFFDVSNLLGNMKGLMEGAVRAKHGGESNVKPIAYEPEEGDDDLQAVMTIAKLIEDIALFDYVASVERTEGYRVYCDTVTHLAPNAKSKPLYGVFAGGKSKTVKDFARFIPKEAANFSVCSGIDFSKLYDYILAFVAKNVPDGEQEIKDFMEIQHEDWGIDIKKDILDLIDGAVVSASMDSDWILMLKVTDEDKAHDLIAGLFDRLGEVMGQGSGLMMSPVKVAGYDGFTQISHPMMMMLGGFSPPVWGCAEGYLILGSNAAMVTRCLETAQGKHPNITKNPRFREEGLAPKSGPVDSISFTDQSNMAQEIQQMLGALSMGMGMASMMVQNKAEDVPPEFRSLLSAITEGMTKLGPVVGKLDFFQSRASYSTFDGRQWYTRAVQNYKTPKPRSQEADDKGDEDEADDADQNRARKKAADDADEDDDD